MSGVESCLESIVKQLKKNSNATVYNALVALRTKFLKEDNGVSIFRQCGGVQLLIYHIQKPNYKIVELTLSILGNCCLESETRTMIRRLDGIPHIVRILESLEKVSILNRACRTLANLALDIQNAEEIHKKDATKLIINLLSTQRDNLFRQSAIRALRILATTTAHREKVNQHGGTDCLGKLLVASDSNLEVLQCVLKALAALTTNCSAECARQMQNVEYLEKLVSLAIAESLEETSLHILANLSRQETIRPALGSAGIVPVLIKQVAKWEKSSPGWQWAVDALCLCTREAVNRVRIREEGGLDYILTLFKDNEDERLWLCSLASLMNFLYDDMGFAALVELGMSSALVDRFTTLVSQQQHVTHTEDVDIPPDSPEKCNPGGDVEQDDGPLQRPFKDFLEDGGCSTNVQRQRSFHFGCTSPESSPPYWTSFPFAPNFATSPSGVSPKSELSPKQSNVADEFCYSPVYEWSDSEDGDGSVDGSRSSRETASILEMDSPSVSLEKSENGGKDDYDSDQEVVKNASLGRSPLGDMLLLFSRLSLQENPCSSFLKSGAFLAILDYATSVENPQPRAKRCLSRIVRNPLCFEHLVLHRIPSHLHHNFVQTQHRADICAACSSSSDVALSLLTDLRLQAELSFGSGCLLHLLVGKTDQHSKLSAAVAAAYLLKSPQVRKKIFLDSVGLSTLTKSLEDCDMDEFDDAWKGLVHFAKSVVSPLSDTKNSQFGENSTKTVCKYADVNSWRKDAELRVSGEAGIIAVNRDILAAGSDVFNAMMCGHFIESKRQTIELGDSSYKAVEYMVHYLYCCSVMSCPTLQSASESISFLLEVLALSDKFLLTRLRDLTTQQIMKCNPTCEELEKTLLHAKLYNSEPLKSWVHTRLLISTHDSYEAKRQQFLNLMACDKNLLEDCCDFLSSMLSAQIGC